MWIIAGLIGIITAYMVNKLSAGEYGDAAIIYANVFVAALIHGYRNRIMLR
ncbi:MAG: hypothetical protein QME35_06400 [Thermoanaerobacteraceae bacterium]|nr:hypothetical protein [Thermoanaerobacteraceae bacterium]